ERLDEELLELAKESGAHVMQPARCEQLVLNGGFQPRIPPRLIVRDLVTNQQRSIDAELVLIADGKAALLPHRPPPTRDLGIKAHFADVAGPRDAIELFGVEGHYGGLAPIENDRWNASFSVPAATVQHFRGDSDALFMSMLHHNRSLRARMRTASRVSAWLA